MLRVTIRQRIIRLLSAKHINSNHNSPNWALWRVYRYTVSIKNHIKFILSVYWTPTLMTLLDRLAPVDSNLSVFKIYIHIPVCDHAQTHSLQAIINQHHNCAQCGKLKWPHSLSLHLHPPLCARHVNALSQAAPAISVWLMWVLCWAAEVTVPGRLF